MLDWSIQVENQFGEQDNKITLEHSEFKIAVRRPMVMPRMQSGYIAVATEEGRKGVNDGGKKGNYWFIVMEVHKIEKRVWACALRT